MSQTVSKVAALCIKFCNTHLHPIHPRSQSKCEDFFPLVNAWLGCQTSVRPGTEKHWSPRPLENEKDILMLLWTTLPVPNCLQNSTFVLKKNIRGGWEFNSESMRRKIRKAISLPLAAPQKRATVEMSKAYLVIPMPSSLLMLFANIRYC